jgi:membrane protein DedA with SNARE-associated domain
VNTTKIISGPEGQALMFAWVFAEQVGLPLPAAPALLAAGAFAARGPWTLVSLIVTAVTACILADSLWYWAGRSKSADVYRFLRSHPKSRVVRCAERLFAAYGSRSLLFAKFVPGLSLVAPPLSGIQATAASRFLAFDAVGALVWAGGFITVGYFFGSAFDRVIL